MRLGHAVQFVLGMLVFTLATPATSPGQTAGKEDVSIVERGPHHKVVQRVSWVTNDAGAVSARTNSYTELATGMHYRESEQWRESVAKIELLPNNAGAVASEGQHKAIFPPEIKTGLIELNTPDNQWLRSRVTGLSYFDEATGKSVLLASVQTSAGQLAGDNSVVYPNAFAELVADIRYTYTLAGFEQDVVLREQPPSPDKFGLNPKTTRLQVLTEFVEAPAPAKTSREIAGLTDQTLGFGEMMSIGAGKAFSVDAAGDTTGQVPVAKSWTPLGGRNFLIEEVRYEAVAEQLQKLPIATKYKGAGLRRRGVGENVIAGLKKLLPKRYAKAAPKPGKQQMAQAKPQTAPSFVMDYVILNTSQNNYTFKGDTTYYISGTVNLSGTTTIEGGAVVKFSSSASTAISVQAISCPTNNYQMAVFTAKDDDTVGEIISGSTGDPTASYYGGGIFGTRDYENEPNYSNLRFSFLRMGIHYEGTDPVYDPFYIWNVQAVNCDTFLDVTYAPVNIENGLFHNVNNFIVSHGATITAEHVTLDNCGITAGEGLYWLPGFGYVYAYNYLTFVNSLLVQSSYQSENGGWFENVWENNSPTIPFAGGVFRFLVGAGAHYLANNSIYRNQATASINPKLLAQLKTKTTYWPLVMSGPVDVATVLSQRAIRDTDVPDLGYHYSPLDYCVSGLSLNAPLALANGVAVGIYGPYGFESGTLLSVGTAKNHNQIALYSAVQEQPVAWGGYPSATYLLNSWASATRFQFTDISLAGSAGLCSSSSASSMEIRDCYLHAAKLTISGSYYATLGFTNNIIERCDLVLLSCSGTNYYASFYNNLFLNKGNLSFGHACNQGIVTNFEVKNNLFVNGSFTYGTGSGGTPQIFNNGYHQTTVTSQGTSPIAINNLGFQTGPLGNYYYPTTVAAGSLSDLIDAGSMTAVEATLDQYTTRTDQTADSGTVDIGFHYKAPPPCDNPSIEGWVFTDKGFIAGGQIGVVKRSYASPSDVPASPWSFQSADQRSLRMSFENDYNCASPPYNPNNQIGTAEAVIWVTCPRRMSVTWTGKGEQKHPTPSYPVAYELMNLFVDNVQVGSAHSPGGGLECAPMNDVVSDPASPLVLQPGIHLLRIETETYDERYHIGAYYQFNLSFAPP